MDLKKFLVHKETNYFFNFFSRHYNLFFKMGGGGQYISKRMGRGGVSYNSTFSPFQILLNSFDLLISDKISQWGCGRRFGGEGALP